MYLLYLLPWWALPAAVAAAGVLVAGAIFAVTRSWRLASLVGTPILCAAMLYAGAEFFIRIGEDRMRVAFSAAFNEAERQAARAVEEQRQKDVARIKDLEKRASQLADQVRLRDEARANTKLPDACESCRVPRSWMKGGH